MLLPLGPFLPLGRKSITTWIALGGLVIVAFESARMLTFATQPIFLDTYAVDQFAVYFKLFAVASTAFVLLARHSHFRGRPHEGEVPALLLVCLGIMGLAASQDLALSSCGWSPTGRQGQAPYSPRTAHPGRIQEYLLDVGRLDLAFGEQSVSTWVYNGAVPGPEIRLTEGDRLRVTVHNHLSEDTTIHWHGLPIPNSRTAFPVSRSRPSKQVSTSPTTSLLQWPAPTSITPTLVCNPIAGCTDP